jgi:hypothetical protein
MIQRRGFLLIGGVLLLFLGVAALITAVKQQTARGGRFVTLSTMQEDSETLAQLRTKPSFSAEVLSVLVRESTNIAREHGITNQTETVTNLYAIRFREPDGQARLLAGMNATSDQLRVLKRLQEGQVYTFPDELPK